MNDYYRHGARRLAQFFNPDLSDEDLDREEFLTRIVQQPGPLTPADRNIMARLDLTGQDIHLAKHGRRRPPEDFDAGADHDRSDPRLDPYRGLRDGEVNPLTGQRAGQPADESGFVGLDRDRDGFKLR